jgi:DNA primase
MAQPCELVNNGREIRYNCPNCDDTNRHMYVNANRSLWYCFKCGKGGKVQYQNQEPNLDRYKSIVSKQTKFDDQLFNKPNAIKSLPLNQSLPHIEIAEDCESGEELTARQYLNRRGVTQEEITKYKIKFSLEKNGPYKNSIIFPVYSKKDWLDYFVCRKWDNSKPKYVNAPWPKGDTLFFTNPSQTISNINVIVEGILDALAIARVGYNGIALLGKTATSQQLSRLSNVYGQCIIYLDNDALSHAVQLKLQLDTLGNKTRFIRHSKDAADLYLEGSGILEDLIRHAR